jgi:SWI/SNF-related matrix-associated actin-dependent regulator of chromatin subfamily A-like protein 1
LQLTYQSGVFVLLVNRGEGDIRVLMEEHGLDFSTPGSTADCAQLFTREAYAAVAFYDYADETARPHLAAMHARIEASRRPDGEGLHIKCPADQELAPFQKSGVHYAMTCPAAPNCLVGDAPGLGKTMQGVCIANEMGARRVLVLCPANLRIQWVSKIRTWTTMRWPYHVYPILSGRSGVNPTANWTVVSYDLARTPNVWKALVKGTYDLVILDECHYLKSVDALRTRTVFGGGLDPVAASLASRAGAVVGLTGTPLPNRPREAYTAARGLCFDAIDWASEEEFRTRFNPSEMVEWTDAHGHTKRRIDERSGRHGELQARLRSNFMVRREKHGPNGVGYQLRIAHVPVLDLVHLEESAAVKQALQAEKLLDIDPENLEGADMSTLGSVATVRRLMGVAMAPLAAEYIDGCLDGGEEKIIVFAHHTEALDIIQAKLAKHGVLRIDGSVGPAKRQQIVNRYVADPKTKVLLGNMIAMGTGTDGLQEVAWHCVLAEPDWVLGVNQQAIDRLDRGGQAAQVQADLLVVPGSFSEKVLASALRKGATVDKVLDRRM